MGQVKQLYAEIQCEKTSPEKLLIIIERVSHIRIKRILLKRLNIRKKFTPLLAIIVLLGEWAAKLLVFFADDVVRYILRCASVGADSLGRGYQGA